MNNPGVIVSILRNIRNDEDIVRYCSTNSKIRRICKEYSQQLFGESYEDIIYRVMIKHSFPSLTEEISLDDLYDYYKSYRKIWKELNKITGIQEIPMCIDSEDFVYKDEDGNEILAINPTNIKYIAPYHKAIIEGAKEITFVFFRHLNKLPTNIFTIKRKNVITPYEFMIWHLVTHKITKLIHNKTKAFLYDDYNKSKWNLYINDPYWSQPGISEWYPLRTLQEELDEIIENTTCESYPAIGFERNEKTKLIEKYLDLDHPVVEIDFNT